MDSEVSTQLVDEAARRRFEVAWRTGNPAIEDHLPPTASDSHLPTLEELVHIDLEMRWKTRGEGTPAPRVEDYLARFPALDSPAVVLRLLRQEFRVRQKFGDRPETAEYRRRFPALVESGAEVETLVTPTTRADEPPRVPGYEILDVLGRGGMGVVYKARHVALDRVVALKMIRGGVDDQDLVRFQTEAEAVARIHHPNIVQVYEVGTADGRPYLSLEFVPGGSLDAFVAGTPQPPHLAAAAVERLARAIAAAHEQGVLHRDLKPANILLAPAEPGGPLPWVPKVADFGLAKRLEGDAGHTQTGAILGTPSFMSPEQAAARPDVGPAADVYALGAVLYHALTGRPPFRAASVWDTISQVLHDDPVPPSRFHPHLPRDLETICLKCLQKEPARRYATAAALADDLGRFLRGEPVAARPVGTWGRVAKWVRRRPAAAGLLAAVAVAALATVGGGVALYFNGRLRDALGLAESRRVEADGQRVIAEGNEAEAKKQKTEADRQKGIAEQQEAEAKKQRAEADRQRDMAERFQYVAQINLARRVLDEGDVPRALAVLERYEPKRPGEPDRRGFEWYHLRRLTRNLHALRGHTDDIPDVAFSPNGRFVASAGWDNTIRIWDAITGKHLYTLSHPTTGKWTKVGAVAFNPDGTRLAATYDTTATLFDTTTWKPVATLRGHTAYVSGVEFSPDGTRIATADSGGAAKVWDAGGKLLFTLPGEPNEIVRRVAFTRDGSHLAWASAFRPAPGEEKIVGGAVKLWDLDSRTAAFVCRWDGRKPNDVAVDAGGRIAVAFADGPVEVLDPVSGEQLLRFDGHESGATAVRFTSDGGRLATTGYDLVVRVWDARRGNELLALRGHTDRGSRMQPLGKAGVNRVAFSPDGLRLASSGDDRAVMVWDVGPALDPFPPRTAPPAPKNGVYSPDRSRLAVWQRPVVELREPTGKVLHALTAESEQARSLWFGPGNDRLVCEFGRPVRDLVQVWDAETGRPLVTARPPADDTLSITPDGRWFVAAGDGVRLWELATGRVVATRGGHETRVKLTAVSPDGKWLATAGTARDSRDLWLPADGEVRVWDTATGELVAALRGHTWAVRGLAWSPDSRAVASASQDGTVRVWEPRAKAQIQLLAGHQGSVFAVAFSPDGRRVASAGEDRTVHLWDVACGEEVLTLGGHAGPVWDVGFGPAGRYLFSRNRPVEKGAKDVWKAWDARPPDEPAPPHRGMR